MKPQQAWQAALGQLQMEMPKAAFDTWVRDAELVSFEDGAATIGVHNTYARDWLESRLTSTLQRLLTGILNTTVTVVFVLEQSYMEDEEPETQKGTLPLLETESSANPTLNPRQTFDTFVVGSENRLAQAASLVVAEKPGGAYNPLFLLGGIGLGKTHLLHAIGNKCHDAGLKVLFTTAEDFTNELVAAIRTHTTQGFRDKFRRVEVLLVDEIEFICGKEATMEEFFHTFNALHGAGKQIVVTSPHTPKELGLMGLEKRLVSRFEWGLVADLQAPEFELRLAILNAKARILGYKVPHDILETVACNVNTSVRALEGALTRVQAFSSLQGLDFSDVLVARALETMKPDLSELEISVRAVIETTAQRVRGHT